MRQNSSSGRYLIRGFFATTLGIMWLMTARQITEISPALFVAILSMAVGAEMVGVGLLRERIKRSLS